jgi:phosphatidylglycerophosphate synthase
MTQNAPAIAVESVGENPTPIWGLSNRERTRRIAAASGLLGPDAASATRVIVNDAYAWDPAWLGHIAENPGLVLTMDHVPVLAHARTSEEAEAIRTSIRENRPLVPGGLTVLAYENSPTIENKRLRKRETPFLMALAPDTIRRVERASYFGAYKGVTDILTKYLWPEWALVITRICARFGIMPNVVTATGAILCVLATVLFARGDYWEGMAVGLGFMVLDTVDGKLARCTITSSWWGNILDHGIDLIHPPFWWWFWATGLVHWGLELSPESFNSVMIAAIGGYVLQRVIEGIFMRRNGGMHIHVWRRFDSRFRLITARRNPNMVILLVSMIFGRPDLGIVAVAWWTVISCAIHAVRLLQAEVARTDHGRLTSWLSEA